MQAHVEADRPRCYTPDEDGHVDYEAPNEVSTLHDSN